MRPARKGPETQRAVPRLDDALVASMRPARKGPETPARHRPCRVLADRFNEAGPQGAGNETVLEFALTGPARLQ